MVPSCKLLTAALLLLAACTSVPDTQRFKVDFDKGVSAYEAGDYVTARKLWQPLADNYDLAALRNLGHLYRLGQGVDKNPKKARDYYEKAANVGHAPSQTNLAQMYFAGDGITTNREKGMFWLKKAAAQGYPPAQQQLAIHRQRFEFHSR
ncbi:sel1 repeat family protein [Alphaproteobacteria bacterium]|nr:sel1 repeat family protein [Alphaproteobacteria bacterium]MDB2641309.1 sel1 repeat family protein [Alphaproteobacteria bacterium]